MASVIAAVRARLAGWVRHLARIRYRLLLINVIVAAVPVFGMAFAEMHERQLLAALASSLCLTADGLRVPAHHRAIPAPA